MTANTIKSYSFDRNSVKAGILHFGVGNFHRAHLEYMTSHLLEDPTQHGWGNDTGERRTAVQGTQGAGWRIHTYRMWARR